LRVSFDVMAGILDRSSSKRQTRKTRDILFRTTFKESASD